MLNSERLFYPFWMLILALPSYANFPEQIKTFVRMFLALPMEAYNLKLESTDYYLQ